MRKTVAAVVAIELIILVFLFTRHYLFSLSEEINAQKLSVSEDLSEISSPSIILEKKGIYELTAGYELSADGGDDVLIKIIPDDEDRYAVDSEEVSLKSFTKSLSLRIYCRNADVPVKVVIRNHNNSEHSLTVHGFSIRYLNRKTAFYYSLWLLFWFIIIDALFLLCYFIRAGRIPKERLKVGFLLAMLFLLTNLPMYVDYIPSGHDLGFHLLRIAGIAQGLSDGSQFPVRIYPNIYNGYGYALGVCYGDSLLYVPALLYNLGFPLRQAYKAYIFFFNCITVFGGYYCFYRVSGNRQISFAGTLIYSMSVWRLVDIYTRAAIGEFSAMAFLPFIVLGFFYIFSEDQSVVKPELGAQAKPLRFLRLPDKRFKGIICLAFGYAGMIHVHVLSVIITGIFSFFFCLANIKRLFCKKRFTDIVSAAFFCLLLSAGTLVPLADYYINEPLRISKETTYIQGRGVYIAQLLSTFFYPTESSVSFNSDTRMAYEMPLSIGWASLIILTLAIYMLLSGRIKEKKNELKQTAGLAVLSLAFSLTAFPYDWIADRLPAVYKVLGSIQFPARFLIISAMLSAASFVFLLYSLIKEECFEIRMLITFICLISAWQGVSYMSRYINESRYYYIANDDAEQDTFSYDISEYLLEDADSGFIMENGFIQADAGIEIKDIKRHDLDFDISLDNPASDEAGLEAPVFAYKGFEALTEGGKLDISYGKSNRIRVTVPSGFSGDICIRFREPIYWRLAELVSAVCWILLVAYVVREYLLKKRKKALETNK